MSGSVPRSTYDNVVIVKRDAVTGDEAFDGKIKNLVYNSVTMDWEAQLPAVAGGAGGDASAANQVLGNASLASIDTKTPALGQALMAASQPVVIASNQSAVPVSGTFYQATQPVSIASMPSTPVTGTFWQATQPVSGPLTDTQLRATAVPVSATLAAETTKVIGTVNIAASQTLSTVTTVAAVTGITNALPAGTNLIGAVSLGNSTGKTNVMKTGSLASSAATADQVILTYTVTAGKTFYLEYFDVVARLTTFAATATNFGNVSLESPAATKLYTGNIFHAGSMTPYGVFFSEPIPIAAGTVIRIVCTPSAVTAMTWTGNLGGYEK